MDNFVLSNIMKDAGAPLPYTVGKNPYAVRVLSRSIPPGDHSGQTKEMKKVKLTSDEILALRETARRYAEIASLPEQTERRLGWERFNTLCPERPRVLLDQIPWNELNPDGCLDNHVLDPYWAQVETWMLREIYKWEHMRADMVVDPWIKVPLPVESSGWGLEARVTRLKMDRTSDVASQHMENLIREPEDLEKIRVPVLTLKEEEKAEIARWADVLFEGILPWRFTGLVMHLGAWDTIAYWMGVENLYMELMDRPEMMHALMEKMTEGYLSMIRQASEMHIMDTAEHYCHCSHTYRPDDPPLLPGTSREAWAFGLAQPFTAVSPRITEEFECAYMKRIFPHFRHIYYGCCDRLDDRLELVSALPNVRKISCSPWSHREAFAEKLPKQIIMSNKPSPAFLAEDTFDEEAVRADLRRTIQAARKNGVQLEMILKDISTVRYEPRRLWRFSEIALEECMRDD